MRVLLPATFVAIAAWTATATAQMGLYGSPDMIELLPTKSEQPAEAVPASFSSPWSSRPLPYQVLQPRPAQPAAPAPAQQPVYAQPQPAPQQAYVPATRQVYAPAPQQVYAPAPQQVYAPAPQQAYTPPQQAYAPAPQQQVYGPALQRATPQPIYAQPSPMYGAPNPPKAPKAPKAVAQPVIPELPQPEIEPQPAPTASMVDQMLSDPSCCGQGTYAGETCDDAVYGACGTDASELGQAACGTCCAPCPWYASVTALFMARDEGNRFFFTADSGNNANQQGLVHWQWRAGGEVRFGRRFCCGTWALEGAYWGLDAFTGGSVVSNAAGLNTPIQLDYVQFYNNAGDHPMATDIIDGAIQHRLWRRSEMHSAEVNVLREGMLCDACHPLDVNWGIGFRFFRFEDDLRFGALHSGSWGADPTQEAYIDENLKNNLYGVQLTLDMNYYLNPNWRVFLTPRFGVYANHIEQDFQVYRGDGVVARSTDPSVPGSFPVKSSKDVVSFMTQVDLGVSWAFARNWSVGGGYRVLVATGIGLDENQFTPYLVDLPEIANIDYNGELILHGAFVNVTYNF